MARQIRVLRPLHLLSLGLLAFLALMGVGWGDAAGADQEPEAPFALPLQGASGAATWLLEQHYGNTVEAYTYGKYWYAEGQGLHFGLDLEAPCGTPVTAIGDGVTQWVNNGSFGAGPNNLVLVHPDLGYVSVYGHLRDRPNLTVGQPVRRGQVIGVVGDPDLTCLSRPHLHLEIRSLDYRTAYNPARLIAADWDVLATLAKPIGVRFAQDLQHPRRWQTLDDQPLIAFGNRLLNVFAGVWPPPLRTAPTETTRPAFTAPDLTAGALIRPRRVSDSACCAQFWWSPDSREVIYLDGPDGEIALARALNVESGQTRDLGAAPPALLSADGRYSVRVASQAVVRDLRGGGAWAVIARGAWPVISPGSRWLMWHVRPGDYFPNSLAPRTEIWIAPIDPDPDKRQARLIHQQAGGAVYWLDDNRLLLVEQLPRIQRYTLSVYHIDSEQIDPLATVDNLRRLSVAPGGAHVLMFLPFQASAEQSGLYLLATQPGATPQKLPFLGGAQWRDQRSLVYIIYTAHVERARAAPMGLHVYDIQRKVDLRLNLAEGLRIRNDTWHVSPDGRAVAFISARDGRLWLLEIK